MPHSWVFEDNWSPDLQPYLSGPLTEAEAAELDRKKLSDAEKSARAAARKATTEADRRVEFVKQVQRLDHMHVIVERIHETWGTVWTSA